MEHVLTISDWARSEKISYKTAWRMVQREDVPSNLEVVRLPTGSIRLHLHPEGDERPLAQLDRQTVIYARINPRETKELLDRQVELCRSFCAAQGWIIHRTVREKAPSVGAKREKLRQLLDVPPRRIVVTTSAILSRFDSVLITSCLKNMGCDLVVIDQSFEREGQGGAIEDLIDAISITCHRHYGFKRGTILVEMLRRLVEKNML